MMNKENPGTGATVHGAKRSKSRENLLTNYTDNSISCQSAAAQRQRILAWLLYDSLTTFEAREKLNIPHPAGRIQSLRVQGYEIKTEWTTEFSAGGSRHRIARYILAKQEGYR